MGKKSKTWIRNLLFIITLVLIGTWSVSTFGKAPLSKKENTQSKTAAVVNQPKSVASDTTDKQEARQLVVYYFMTSQRCHSCIFIEGTTRKALDEYFANELKSGRIVFKMLNIEEPQNKHFIDEYGLFTKSVVLSDLNSGKQTKWKYLDQVWNMIGQEEEFKAYIAKEVKAFLGS